MLTVAAELSEEKSILINLLRSFLVCAEFYYLIRYNSIS